ncbi:MAG: class I SAM-dependent RNA methyltransferase [Bauldia sp.]|nr:MAG: class I SAM-dependent RNA methyltransferase [Bauldia sp.]
MPESRRLTIDKVGAQGDGVARDDGNVVHVPGALPGEVYEQSGDGERRLVSDPSPARRARYLCPHFPRCGGCSVQHMSDDFYANWKSGLLAAALGHRGLEAPVAPMIVSPLRSRRRATFALANASEGGVAGFHRARSEEIEPMTACAVLDPAFEKALPALRRLAEAALPRGTSGRLTLTKVKSGFDAALSAPRLGGEPNRRAAIIAAASSAGIIRLSVAGETWMQSGKAEIEIGGLRVSLSPGVFLQATGEAEAALIGLLAAGLRGARSIADLFAGVGTFALPLARAAPVSAYDSDRNALGALADAVRRAQGLKPVSTGARDLFRYPLSPKELEAFDAVVLDPPFAGAKAQAEALAISKVRRIAVVSCNPATLARDLRILVDGGYRITAITPVDQFLFSHHLEAVALLDRSRI